METTIDSRIEKIEEAIKSFGISESYFSDILGLQLTVFSIIVGVLVTLYFLFNWRVQKAQIESEIQQEIERIKKDLEKELLDKASKENKDIEEKLNRDLLKHESDIGILRGEVYRSMALFWDNQNSFAIGFIWWLRSARAFASSLDDKMTRISLENTRISLGKIPSEEQLPPEFIGEYQELVPAISDSKFKLEKELLDKAMKKHLN